MSDEKLRATLRGRLKEVGLSAREASRRLGKNLGYVGDIIEGRSKAPDAETVLRLADVLDLDATDLLGDSVPTFAVEERRFGEALPFGEERRIGGRMLALFAAPMPIRRQFVPFGAEPMGRVPCPPMLLDVPDAFAALVPNNASAPRYFAGETIYINPAATAAPGDFVWCRRNDEQVAIGRLADMGAESFKLEFLGLDDEGRVAEVPYSEVRAIKKIVASAV